MIRFTEELSVWSTVMPGPRTQLSVVFFVILSASASVAQLAAAHGEHFRERGQENVGAGSARSEKLRRQITEQEVLLADYRTRIKTKSQEVEEALQLWVLTGNEAGQDLAFAMQQRQLEVLKKSLTPLIDDAEKKLSALKVELAQVAQSQTTHVPAAQLSRRNEIN
jgi:hypothetical protein